MDDLKFWICIILCLLGITIIPLAGRMWYQDYLKEKRLIKYKSNCINYGVRFIPKEYIKISNDNNLLDKINVGNISEIYKTLGIDYIEKTMSKVVN